MAETKTNSTYLFGEVPDDESFWLKLVSECLENPVTKLPTGKKLLVLGDNDAEKTRLLRKLQGNKADVNFTKGNGLEFLYLTAKDEYGENQTKLGVWILDGDPFYKPLLKYALDVNTLADTIVLLVASMTKPWVLFDTIITWTEILRNHIEGLQMTEDELEQRKKKVLERFREYVEPGLSIYGSLAADNTRELPVNLGVEFIVVVTKTEYMKELQTEFGYEEEHFDFIQLSLREFCLSHGAALFYVSVKEDKNCDLLLKYILHKVYSFPFRIPAVLVERESILVPAGWDNKNKIRFLSETLTTIPSSTPYEDVVFKPARLSDTKRLAPEVVAQSDQDFLVDMMAALERQATEEKATDIAKDTTSMTATVVQRNVARRMTRAQASRSPQKKLEEKLVAGGDTTLSNFFHSLLNRRTSAPVDRPVGFSGGRTLTPKHNAELSTHRNISGLDSTRNKNTLYSQDIDEQNSSDGMSQKSSEESSENDSEESSNSKLKNTAHLSLDQQEKDGHLPEYFMSSQSPEGARCTTDCSFQRESSSSFDFEDDVLDRVSSSYNPPLKQILENQGPQQKDLTNGEVKYPAQGTSTNGFELNKGSEDGSLPFDSLNEPDSVMSSMPFKINGHDENTLENT